MQGPWPLSPPQGHGPRAPTAGPGTAASGVRTRPPGWASAPLSLWTLLVCSPLSALPRGGPSCSPCAPAPGGRPRPRAHEGPSAGWSRGGPRPPAAGPGRAGLRRAADHVGVPGVTPNSLKDTEATVLGVRGHLDCCPRGLGGGSLPVRAPVRSRIWHAGPQPRACGWPAAGGPGLRGRAGDRGGRRVRADPGRRAAPGTHRGDKRVCSPCSRRPWR